MRTRRICLLSAVIIACAGAALADAPKIRLGVISDIHLTDAASAGTFEATLEYFDRRKVDGVVLCGDLADHGRISELELAGAVWDRIFPGGRRSDGGHVEQLFIFGDHDASCNKEIFRNDRFALWERIFHERWDRIRVKRVKGYDFMLASFDGDWGNDTAPINEALKKLDPEPGRPFFYVQHRIPKGTVGGHGMWGCDIGRVTKALSGYPNAIAFFGHAHHDVTDEQMVWQDAFTAFEIPSLSYLETRAGRENGYNDDDGRPSGTYEKVSFSPPRQMRPEIRFGHDDRQGCVYELYPDRMVVERLDMLTFVKVAPDWVVPYPIPETKPFSPAVRAAATPAPAFPKGSEALVREVSGTDRSGAPTVQYEVTFPPAQSTAVTPRAFDYEVTASTDKADVRRIVLQKRVFSRKRHLDEARDRERVVCLFAKSELPDDYDTLDFTVRPMNAFGLAGESITTAAVVRRRGKQ